MRDKAAYYKVLAGAVLGLTGLGGPSR